MTSPGWIGRLEALAERRGREARTLRLGPWQIVLEGLDAALAARLDRRWGAFVTPAGPAAPTRTVRVFRAGPERWFDERPEGRIHRLEAERGSFGTAIRAHHFALAPEADPAHWRCGLVDPALEPDERALENGVRYLVARLAVEAGGIALHGAAFLRNGEAWVFAGPSQSGKSTAVSLSQPGQSLGDDFAVVVPSGAGWQSMAVPFDNREVAPAGAPHGLLPLAGILRLFQAPHPRVVAVPRVLAVASLMACAAMTPVMPDLAGAALSNAEAFVQSGWFAHLYFRKAPDFWPLLSASR